MMLIKRGRGDYEKGQGLEVCGVWKGVSIDGNARQSTRGALISHSSGSGGFWVVRVRSYLDFGFGSFGQED